MMSLRALAAIHTGSLLLMPGSVAPCASAQADNPYVPAMNFATVTLHDSDATQTCDLAHGFVLGTSAFGVTNCDLTSLIAQAYGMRRDQVVGLPSQIFTYDIYAKAGPADEARIATLSVKEQLLEQHHMLQNLLNDRFHLRMHTESRLVRSFDLIVGRRGPMMNVADPAESAPDAVKRAPLSEGEDEEKGRYCVGRAATMEDLAGFLSGPFDRPVFDRTGLTAKYDFNLHYRGIYSHVGEMDSTSVPPLDQAIQWQLGVRVVPSPKGTELYILVDHAERPKLD